MERKIYSTNIPHIQITVTESATRTSSVEEVNTIAA